MIKIKKATIYLLSFFVMAAFVVATINCHEADFDEDGDVDLSDFAHFSNWYNYNYCNESNDWCEGCDFEPDGDVDLSDFGNFADWYGKICYDCTDTDGGFNVTINASVYGWDDGSWYDYDDYCINSYYLREYYCEGLYWTYSDYWCNITNSTCAGGACR